MNITLYKYSNRSLIANKMEDRDLITLFSGNITPYGEFNGQKVSFRLSDLYQANYCKYEFNGKNYYGYVNVDVDSKGLYVYNVVVDALSSCWYNNCFDTPVLVERMTFGQSQNKDSEIVWKDRYLKTQYSLTGKSRNIYILIQAVWCGFENIPLDSDTAGIIKKYFIPEHLDDGEKNDHYIYSPGVITYLLTLSQWEVFLDTFLFHSNAAKQKSIATSIFRIAAVDGDLIRNDKNEFPGAAVFPVAAYIDSKQLNYPCLIFCKEEGHVITVPISNAGIEQGTTPTVYHSFAQFYLHTDESFSNSGNFIERRSVGYTPDSIRLNSYEEKMFQFFFPNAASVLVKLRDLPTHIINEANSYKISSIGYRSYFDPGSFIATYYPEFNEEVLLEFPTQTEVSTQFPLPVDTSITNWYAIGASALATIGTTVATIVSGGLTAPALIHATTGLGATAASAIAQETNGGFMVKGVSGGSTEWTTGQGIYFIVYTQLPEVDDIDAFNEEFGKPHEQIENITRLSFGANRNKMYVKTRNANLESNGMPSQLIQEAQRISNTGFYILKRR